MGRGHGDYDTYPLESGVLWCRGQTAELHSLWDNHTHHASGEPGYRSVGGEERFQYEKLEIFLIITIDMDKQVAKTWPWFFPLEIVLRFTDVEALVCDKEFGHGAKGHSIRSALLKCRCSLAYQKTRRNQLGGHLRQFELQILWAEHTQEGLSVLL